MVNRPSWDDYFLGIAKVVSSRASCPRASSGCVLVLDKRILSTGYNGAPVGEKTCLDIGCNVKDRHCVRAVHGERNAILWAEKYFSVKQLKEATLYEYYAAHSDESVKNYYPSQDSVESLDFFPCKPCKELMLDRKIKEVICQYGNGIIKVYKNYHIGEK
ncbi:dCMP deaminase [Candidatus Daviesbacteria bacterium]|nr:dCMP deaminase [Candidatus Daviesbacteria bacterium]